MINSTVLDMLFPHELTQHVFELGLAAKPIRICWCWIPWDAAYLQNSWRPVEGAHGLCPNEPKIYSEADRPTIP